MGSIILILLFNLNILLCLLEKLPLLCGWFLYHLSLCLAFSLGVVLHILSRLNRFEVYANLQVFIKIFAQKGGHLWHKFNCNYSNNSVQFFGSLDGKNQALLIAYLERYTRDY